MAEGNTVADEFGRWFGVSKVVDTRGKPLVVYHGTAAVFSEFRESPGWYGSGIYFTPNPDIAAEFARERALDTLHGTGDTVMPVYLSLQDPYTFTVKSSKRATNVALLRELGFSAKQIAKACEEYHHLGDAIRHDLEDRGHDGLIVLDRHEGNEFVAFEPAQIKSAIGTDGIALDCGDGTASDHYVVFSPHQIKSAFGNSGAFDPTDPDITDRRAARAREALAMLQSAKKTAVPHG